MDRNDLTRKIDNLKAELKPKLTAYKELTDGAVDKDGKPRAFTAEEFSKHEQIGKDVQALNSQIDTARNILRATDISAQEDEATAEALGLSGAHRLPQASEEYAEKFVDFIRGGAKEAKELYSCFAAARTGGRFENLTGTSPSSGEVLIPTILETEIMQEAAKLSPLIMISNVFATSTRKSQVPFIGDIGVLAPRGEAESYVLTEPTLSSKPLNIFNFGGLFPVSFELLEDAPSLAAMWGPLFGRAYAETVEEYALKGVDGQTDFTNLAGSGVTLTITGKVPPGILSMGTGDVPVVPGTNFTGITFEDVVGLKQAVVAEARRNGVYYLGADAETKILLLKDLDDRPLWMPSLVEGQPARLNGSAYHVTDRLAAVGSEATSMLFGDFRRGHRIALRKNLTVKTSDHFYFGNNSMAVAADVRFGAQVAYQKFIAKLVHPADPG